MNEFDHLDYDPETGVVTRTIGGYRKSRPKIIKVAGYLRQDGYIGISVNHRNYAAHRIAWFKTYGKWPDGVIDHINHITTDNRIVNLRDVPQPENRQNQIIPSGCNKHSKSLGAMLVKSTGRYQAKIGVNGKRIHIGTYPTEELAHQAYLEAKRKLHPACTI